MYIVSLASENGLWILGKKIRGDTDVKARKEAPYMVCRITKVIPHFLDLVFNSHITSPSSPCNTRFPFSITHSLSSLASFESRDCLLYPHACNAALFGLSTSLFSLLASGYHGYPTMSLTRLISRESKRDEQSGRRKQRRREGRGGNCEKT